MHGATLHMSIPGIWANSHCYCMMQLRAHHFTRNLEPSRDIFINLGVNLKKE